MKILVDINHPAHVHLCRNAIQNWISRGIDVLITAREKDITHVLLENYGLDYIKSNNSRRAVRSLAVDALHQTWRIYRIAKKFNPDLLIGSSFAIAQASRLLRGKSIVFGEDDADVVRLFSLITYPFADTIVTPDCLRDRTTRKHVKYPSYHELSYLHPAHFKPDKGVLAEMGLSRNEPFFIIRLVALDAYHDKGKKGISTFAAKELVEEFSKRGKLFLSVEGEVSPDLAPFTFPLAPHRIHDAMFYATMVVSDSQTMTAEAAVLGTPAIRINDFVGKLAYLEELEHKYKLTFGFLPTQERKMLKKVESLLNMPDLNEEWQQRRQSMLKDKIDAAAWITEFVLDYPKGLKKFQEEHLQSLS